MKDYHCFYVDHTFFDARRIGALYSKLPVERNGDTVILATCQRIEAYTPQETNPLACLDLPFRRASGLSVLRKRIVSICAGVASQILGEKNIFFQVKNAFESSECSDPALCGLFAEATRTGRMIKDKHGFHAAMDYDDISLALLRKSIPQNGRQPSLVIVGSGMLARNFLEKDVLDTYADLFFITRSPKNLKKKLDDRLKKNVYRAEEFSVREAGPFHAIIATNNIHADEYSGGIKDMLTGEACAGVFDLSAEPLFPEGISTKFYGDTYSDIYYEYVERYNRLQANEARRVEETVAGTLAKGFPPHAGEASAVIRY